MKKVDLVSLFKDSFKAWGEDHVPRHAAALSYYTIFSLSPLLLLIISLVGLILGEGTVKTELLHQITQYLGKGAAQAIQSMLASQNHTSNIVASVIGFVTLCLGASGVFGLLKASFNDIWHVHAGKKGLMKAVVDNFLSFTMVLGTGFLLLVSLILTTLLNSLGQYLYTIFPFHELIVQILNFVFSFGIITLLFAMIFKFLPDKKIAWNDVWIGAIVTSLLFSAGKFIIGFYLAKSATISQYGAAGSLVIILLWVYYSAQILFFGTEFTKIYANTCGSLCEIQKPDQKPDKRSLLLGGFLRGFTKGLFKR